MARLAVGSSGRATAAGSKDQRWMNFRDLLFLVTIARIHQASLPTCSCQPLNPVDSVVLWCWTRKDESQVKTKQYLNKIIPTFMSHNLFSCLGFI